VAKLSLISSGFAAAKIRQFIETHDHLNFFSLLSNIHPEFMNNYFNFLLKIVMIRLKPKKCLDFPV